MQAFLGDPGGATCAPVKPGAIAGVIVLVFCLVLGHKANLGLHTASLGHKASLGLHTASRGLVLPTASLDLFLGCTVAGPGLVLGCPAAGSLLRLPLPPVLHLLHHHRVVDAAGAVGPHVQLGLGCG